MQGFLDQINSGFGILVSYLYPLLFADIGGIPLIVLTLMTGAVVFTFILVLSTLEALNTL